MINLLKRNYLKKMNDILKKNQDWANSQEGQEALKKITGDGITKKESSELNLRIALRKAKDQNGYLSNTEISRIFSEEIDPDDLGNILKELLIKQD